MHFPQKMHIVKAYSDTTIPDDGGDRSSQFLVIIISFDTVN